MTASVRLDYFYGSEVKTGSFYRVPKAFEANDFYRAASIEVKYLYGVMLDRVGLSARNGWLDEGRVFIYFTLSDVIKCIHAGKNKAVQIIHEMENLGLIQRKKQGQGKPARVFLKNLIEEKAEKQEEPEQPHNTEPDASGAVESSCPENLMDKMEENHIPAQDEKCDTPAPVSDAVTDVESIPFQFSGPVQTAPVSDFPFGDQCAQSTPFGAVQTSDFGKSALPESGSQDFPNSNPNYNNMNKNDFNKINLSPPAPSPRRATLPPMTRDEMEEDKRECRESVKESIGYELLLREYPMDARTIDGYVEILTETLCNDGPYIRIGQKEYSVYEVRDRLYQLTHSDICYVLESMKRTSSKIINMRAYTLTALFNAPLTSDQYYTNLVSQDYAQEVRENSGYQYASGCRYGCGRQAV